MVEMPKVGAVYRAGKTGARVVYRDGSVSQHAPFSVVVFGKAPLKVQGRLVPFRNGCPTYEVKQ